MKQVRKESKIFSWPIRFHNWHKALLAHTYRECWDCEGSGRHQKVAGIPVTFCHHKGLRIIKQDRMWFRTVFVSLRWGLYLNLKNYSDCILLHALVHLLSIFNISFVLSNISHTFSYFHRKLFKIWQLFEAVNIKNNSWKEVIRSLILNI